MPYSRFCRSTLSLFTLALLVFTCLSACAAVSAADGARVKSAAQETPAAETIHAPGATPTAASSPTPTQAASAVPTITAPPVQMLTEGDEVSVPILLYHHVSDEKPDYRYYISAASFREQMEALREAGWTAITTAALADMLRGKAPLPEKALVITFDDGALDVYENAFPVMQEVGFPGVFFLVSSALGSKDYVNADQVKEMVAAGWEIGSHSMTHADLTNEGVNLHLEMYQSAVQLETALDIPVKSFAYPFSAGNENIFRMAPQFGYTNASCAGWNNRQSARNVYCLSRREVRPSMTTGDLLNLVSEP